MFDFSIALDYLKDGKKVAREGWNGKGMWIILVKGTLNAKLTEGSPYFMAGLHIVSIDEHIDMYTARGTMQPGWLASQADILAHDWSIV